MPISGIHNSICTCRTLGLISIVISTPNKRVYRPLNRGVQAWPLTPMPVYGISQPRRYMLDAPIRYLYRGVVRRTGGLRAVGLCHTPNRISVSWWVWCTGPGVLRAVLCYVSERSYVYISCHSATPPPATTAVCKNAKQSSLYIYPPRCPSSPLFLPRSSLSSPLSPYLCWVVSPACACACGFCSPLCCVSSSGCACACRFCFRRLCRVFFPERVWQWHFCSRLRWIFSPDCACRSCCRPSGATFVFLLFVLLVPFARLPGKCRSLPVKLLPGPND